MKFKLNINSGSKELKSLCEELCDEIIARGHRQVENDQLSDFILNLIDLDAPVAYRRKCQEEMVVSVAFLKSKRDQLKNDCYAALVRSISNMLFCVLTDEVNDQMKGYSITPEVGFTAFDYSPGRMFDYMYPVISSHFVLKNRIFNDLVIDEAQELREITDLITYAKELQKLGVLPAPFPLIQFLDQDLIDHLFRLYQIKGLSYGNLSIRNRNYKTDGVTYWMTARGVDKSNLTGPGKDILLVKGYDEKSNEIVVSVTPEYNPRIRVSVDAIEHYMIYREFPETGAIVHVHAWIDDILCTDQVYPCGTRELAENVVSLLKRTSTPWRSEIGLKNHGITVTGPDIRDIFSRITGRLRINVPMFT